MDSCRATTRPDNIVTIHTTTINYTQWMETTKNIYIYLFE